MLSDVLRGLTEHRVIHEFEELFLEIVGSLSSKLGVEISARFQPCTLVKLNNLMNLLKN